MSCISKNEKITLVKIMYNKYHATNLDIKKQLHADFISVRHIII